METILIIFFGSIGWLLTMAATIEIFLRKGQSVWMGIVVGLLLGPIGLIIGLIMPKDQEAIDEKKRLDEYRQAENNRRLSENWAAYQQRLSSRTEQDRIFEIEKKNETLSTISAVALIASPFLMLLIQSEPVQIGLGLAAVAGLVGLVVANK